MLSLVSPFPKRGNVLSTKTTCFYTAFSAVLTCWWQAPREAFLKAEETMTGGFSPQKGRGGVADGEPPGRSATVSSRRCLSFPTGSFRWTLASPLQEMGEAVSLLITSLRKRRVPDFGDPAGAGCVRAGCRALSRPAFPAPRPGARSLCPHTSSPLGSSPAAPGSPIC